MYELIDNILVEKKLLTLRIDCDLDKCQGACCYGGGLGSPLDDQDLDRILGATKMEQDDFSVIQEGLRLKTHDTDHFKGACVFLRDKRCTIYDARPKFCALFPLVIREGTPFKRLIFIPYEHCVFKESESLFLENYKDYLEFAFGQNFVKELFLRVR